MFRVCSASLGLSDPLSTPCDLTSDILPSAAFVQIGGETAWLSILVEPVSR